MDIEVHFEAPIPPPPPPSIDHVVLHLSEAEARILGQVIGHLSYNKIADVLDLSSNDTGPILRTQDFTIELYGLLHKEGLA